MNLPAISISTTFNYKIPLEEQFARIASAGFPYVSFGANEEHSGILSPSGRQRIKECLQQYRLQLDTIHGPRMDLPDSIKQIHMIADAAAELEVPVVVVHAGPFTLEGSEFSACLEAVLKTGKVLEAVARNTGIRFALENVLPGPATELVETALKYLDPTYFGFCYDSSHDQIGGPKPFDLLLRQKNRVCAVHLSDRAADFVDHMPPGEGWIDWETLIAVLKTSVFSGPLLFEVMVTHASQKDTDAFLELVYRQANWINALFQQSV